jgi:hypothetical protein
MVALRDGKTLFGVLRSWDQFGTPPPHFTHTHILNPPARKLNDARHNRAHLRQSPILRHPPRRLRHPRRERRNDWRNRVSFPPRILPSVNANGGRIWIRKMMYQRAMRRRMRRRCIRFTWRRRGRRRRGIRRRIGSWRGWGLKGRWIRGLLEGRLESWRYTL